MRTKLLLLPATTTAFTLAACEAETGSPVAEPEVVVETIGDTTVVRTLSGSVWDAEATLVPEVLIGELDGAEEYLFGWIRSIAVDDDRNIYVFDFQAQHVGVFDSARNHVETLGRQGEGPGEFNRAEAIALLPDGRLVVRNPGNQRVEVFGPEAGQTDQWGSRTAGWPGQPHLGEAVCRGTSRRERGSRPGGSLFDARVLERTGTLRRFRA